MTKTWTIALDGKDLNGSWNADSRLLLFSAMARAAHTCADTAH
jgi:hypothetical protein